MPDITSLKIKQAKLSSVNINKQRFNNPVIGMMILVCFILFGYTGYSFIKYYSPNKQKTVLNSYTSQKAKIKLKFPEPMYVTENIKQEDGWQRGQIIISSANSQKALETDSLTIVYGLPQINGKGGACVAAGGYQQKTILDQPINVCDDEANLNFSAGYPIYPGGGIEYSFFIGGKNITQSRFETYRTILYSGLSFVE